MRVRRARLSDAETILAIFKSTPELQGSAEGELVYSRDYVRACIKDKKMCLVLVAEEKKKIAGVLHAETWKRKRFSSLEDVAVIPEYRSKGFGTKLYNYYEKYCKKKGLKTVLAFVRITNKKMQKFCDKRNLMKGYKFYLYEKKI